MPAAAIQPPPFFRPDEATTNALIAALIDPALSLQALAETHNTTVEALSLWMTRSDIRERLDAIDSTTAWRTRLVAGAQLHAVVGALTTILKDFNAASRASELGSANAVRPPAASEALTDSPSDFRAAMLRLREQELARKSAALLIRLSNFRPLRPRRGHLHRGAVAPTLFKIFLALRPSTHPRLPSRPPRTGPRTHADRVQRDERVCCIKRRRRS